MFARLLRGTFLPRFGIASEDFELLPVGTITQLPQITGTGNCIIYIGTFIPRG